MSETAIRVENLSKRFTIGALQRRPDTLRDRISTGFSSWFRRNEAARRTEEIWALKDVSFEVNRGEVVGVIGRNGAGKSTLLKILSRITEPTEGRAEIHGRVGSLLEVGTGFHPELTGRENIYLNGAILGMKRREIQRKFDEIVAFAETEKFLDTPVKHYSSGMYVRLAFAVAAHLEPEILLVDEVLAVGDAEFQKKCIGIMEEATGEGKCVVIVTHNLAVVANLCGRALLLDQGALQENGTPQRIIEKYLARSAQSGGEVVWDDLATAPGDDTVRVCSVRILQDDSASPTHRVDISKDVVVEITFRNAREGARLYGGLWLKDGAGTWVLASSNADGATVEKDGWFGAEFPCGTFRTRCRIPGNFLNEGRYVVTPIVGQYPNRTLAMAEDAVGFDVHDTGGMRSEYFGFWGGVVRPRLDWQTSPAPTGTVE